MSKASVQFTEIARRHYSEVEWRWLFEVHYCVQCGKQTMHRLEMVGERHERRKCLGCGYMKDVRVR